MQKKPWSGIREAKSHGSACAQIDQISNNILGDEDCLYLNIHTPSLSPSKNLPVMIFIHGGGFVNGSGDSDFLSPESLLENDIVFVAINYRLGILGFLSLGSSDVPGNAGLKDQSFALRWVKENIKSFGGNPNNVTIFGVSAGSASVEFQILSPLSKGLFHKAILQSGSTLNPWGRTRDPSYINKKLLKALNIDQNQNVDDIIKALQAIDTKTLIVSAKETLDDNCERVGEIFSFVTVVEKPNPGAFLDKEPIEILKSGNYNHVPCIIGYCENEGLLFKGMYKFVKDDLLNQNFISVHPKCLYFDEEKIIEDKLKELYVKNYPDKDQSVDEFLGDFYFVGGIYASLKCKLRCNDKVYLYKFQYDGNLNLIKKMFGLSGIKGALHGDDTSYVGPCNYFSESDATEADYTMRKNIAKMWTNFAKYE